MTVWPPWLPDLLPYEDFGGDWPRFIEAVYGLFHRDFVSSKPLFRGRPVNLKRYPIFEGKEGTFWHVTSEGKDESDRLPDLRRCERIRWLRPIIEHPEDPEIKWWINERRGEKRIVLWLEANEYAVILADRGSFVLLWTAYCVTGRRRQQFQKEYEAYHKADAAH